MANEDLVERRAKACPDPERAGVVHYDGPAGGRGSLRGIARIFGEEWPTQMAIDTLARQNKPHG
jgi:hypothetical protein